MCLKKMIVRPVLKTEEARFLDLMRRHHYLGFVSKMGQTLWYVGCMEGQWTSLLRFSVAALKCKARDKWIGWGHRQQCGRLKLIANNNRFLILPGGRREPGGIAAAKQGAFSSPQSAAGETYSPARVEKDQGSVRTQGSRTSMKYETPASKVSRPLNSGLSGAYIFQAPFDMPQTE